MGDREDTYGSVVGAWEAQVRAREAAREEVAAAEPEHAAAGAAAQAKRAEASKAAAAAAQAAATLSGRRQARLLLLGGEATVAFESMLGRGVTSAATEESARLKRKKCLMRSVSRVAKIARSLSDPNPENPFTVAIAWAKEILGKIEIPILLLAPMFRVFRRNSLKP
jgi:hypothetical protein